MNPKKQFSLFLAATAIACTPSLATAEQQGSEGVRFQSTNEGEAKQVFDQLLQFQEDVRVGRRNSITLLSGGASSSEATLKTPREALLNLSLDDLKLIEKIETNDHSGTPFVFSTFPNGRGKIFWDVKVIWLSSKIRHVTVLRRIPAPS